MAKRPASKKSTTSSASKAPPRRKGAGPAPEQVDKLLSVPPQAGKLHLIRDGQEGVYSHATPARLYEVAAKEDREGTAWTIRDDDGVTVGRFNRSAKTWEAVSRS